MPGWTRQPSNDKTLEARLFSRVGTKQGLRRRVEPDFALIHRELKRKHVTLQILWDEYIERHSDGYRYSRFCDLYRGFERRLSVTMRQTHVGGDKLFVDYAGDTVPVVVDRLKGTVRRAQIFVAVMGASNFSYGEATWTQGLCDWIGAHGRAFEAIGGVPNLLVPDNTKVAVIKVCLNEERVIRRLGRTRRQLLEELDRPKLKPLPVEPYVFAEWRIRRVGIDYHVEVEKHFYSVPFRLARQEVEARITARTVEIFVRGERIAAHIRSSSNGGHTTLRDHMPSSHRRHGDWTIDRIRKEASLVGAATGVLCELILERRPHPEQGFRTCIGILRLAKPFGALRLEAASERAIEIGTLSYGSVRSILDKRLDQTGKRQEPGSDAAPILHPNIRGPRYYQ